MASRSEASFPPSDSETRGFWASPAGVLRPWEPGQATPLGHFPSVAHKMKAAWEVLSTQSSKRREGASLSGLPVIFPPASLRPELLRGRQSWSLRDSRQHVDPSHGVPELAQLCRRALAGHSCSAPQMSFCAQTPSSAFPKSKEAFPEVDPLIPPRPAVGRLCELVSSSDEILDFYLGQHPLPPRQHVPFFR